MINELLEVQEYLEGKNINKRCVYRICYLLAKYYHEQGLENSEIRTNIFDWANNNDLYLEFNLNYVIYAALKDKEPLRRNTAVHINQSDITEIRKRFDGKNTRMLAFALLCYGKACAKQTDCAVSLLAISNWIGIDYSNMLKRHFKELIDFGYISKLSDVRKWKKGTRNKMTRIKFNVPFVNEGADVIYNNNVAQVFYKYF